MWRRFLTPYEIPPVMQYIDRAIFLCGHGIYGDKADEEIRHHAQKEKQKGKKYLNHLLYDDGKGRRKHNFLINGVPLISYNVVHAYCSPLEEAVFIGNQDSCVIANMTYNCLESAFGIKKKFLVVSEEGGFAENLRKGAGILGAFEDNHPTLIVSGDLPTAYNYIPHITDEDARNHTILLNLNSQKLIGQFFPRNFHLHVDYQGHSHPVKEANIFPMVFSQLTQEHWDLLELVYGARRTYGNKNTRNELVKDLLLRNGQWKKSVPVFARKYGFHNLSCLARKQHDGLTIMSEQFEDLAKRCVNLDMKIKVTNDDPGTLKDLDSIEDWTYFEAMAQLSDNFASVHPYAPLLNDVAAEIMPTLERVIPLYKNGFDNFINDFCARFDLPPRYIGGKFKLEGFDEQLVLDDIALHAQYTTKSLEQLDLQFVKV